MSAYRVMALVLWLVPCVPSVPGAAELSTPGWVAVDEGSPGRHQGAALLFAPDLQRMLLCGSSAGTPGIQSFDPATRAWTAISQAKPPRERFHPYYQAAYDPGTRSIWCLSGDNLLQRFDLAEKHWKSLPPASELDGLSWHTLAADGEGRLVVVGADKRVDNLGWCRTLVYDIAAGTWKSLVPPPEVRQTHRQYVALREAVIDLVGRLRSAWYRDPRGEGTDAELQELAARCAALAAQPQAQGLAPDIAAVARQIAGRETLAALQSARQLQQQIERLDEAQYPVPCSRRNSPLAYDAKHKLFVLFGGDHEDYLLNDTWVLDLAEGAWQRKQPGVAPSPRAGHSLFALPRRGGVVLYEGYVQTGSTDYGAAPYFPIRPIEMWQYDPRADRWELWGTWPHPDRQATSLLPPVGHFYGYAHEYFSPPAIAADAEDRIVLASQGPDAWYLPWKEFPSRTWLLAASGIRADADGRRALGVPPDQRRYRGETFRAEYAEVADEPPDTGLDRLPENRWVRLPDAPRQLCRGCRQRDWGTAAWDSDRSQVLLWGGGHCVRSASTVVHYSPKSGRMVEGYDADEPYSANGGGGFDSSLWNRPWISAHNYNHYAYDPKCRLLVSGRGYLYDPDRMDWLRIEPYRLPFVFQWGHTVVESSPHGAVAWAQKPASEDFGLWLFDRQQGWIDLEPRGALTSCYCDAHGMVYDARRDRMILSGVGGGYNRLSDGRFLTFDFKTRAVEPLVPEKTEWARTHNARELVYVDHADWLLIGELLGPREEGPGRQYTRVYDCAANRMALLDAGDPAEGRGGQGLTYSSGWMYDAQRKLVILFTIRGEAWALQLNPATARLLDQPER